MPRYVPAAGDLVVLDFDPQSGHEQQGRRPALVVSHRKFSQSTGLAILCPITNTSRTTPYRVPLPPGSGVTGFVMCEQVKSLDVASRRIKRIGTAPPDLLVEVLDVLEPVLFG